MPTPSCAVHGWEIDWYSEPNMETVNDDDPQSGELRTEGRAWIAWGMLVAIAIAVYELTLQPALLGFTIALKFAWGDARTGWWLYSRDMDSRRGRAHFWLYMGYGLWKAAAAAFILGILFASIDNFARPPAAGPIAVAAPKPNRVFFNMVLGSVIGSVVLAVAGSLACLSAFIGALSGQFGLWLNSRVAADRVRDRWPPTQGESNAIIWMGYATGIMLMVVSMIVFLVLFVWLATKGFPAVAGMVLLGLLLFVGHRVAKTIDRNGYEQRLLSKSPDDTWPEPH